MTNECILRGMSALPPEIRAYPDGDPPSCAPSGLPPLTGTLARGTLEAVIEQESASRIGRGSA